MQLLGYDPESPLHLRRSYRTAKSELRKFHPCEALAKGQLSRLFEPMPGSAVVLVLEH
jgi:hypothetical protein